MTRRVSLGALLAGLLAAFGCGREASSVPRLTTAELRERLASEQPPVLLDVRTPGEYASGHLDGAVHVPDYTVESRLQELEPYRGRPIVVYCQSGVRSARVAALLADRGFPEVFDYTEGMAGWRRATR